jgi:hypothetical protein
MKQFTFTLLLISTIFFSSCKKYCWKCDIPHAITRYIDMHGKEVDVETYTEKQRLEVYNTRIYYMHSTYDTTLLIDTITREYCGTKQEMEEDIRVNNIIKEQICYQDI